MKLSKEQLSILREKRTSALEEVKTNCEYFYVLYKYGVPSPLERVGNSFSSIIRINEGGPSEDLGSKISKAQGDYEEDCSHLSRYRRYFESLPENLRDYVKGVYMTGIKAGDYRSGKTKDGIPVENIYRILTEAYIKLACMDDTIDYSAREEFLFINNTKKKRLEPVDIKEYMIAILDELHKIYELNTGKVHELSQLSLISEDDELMDIVGKISHLPSRDQEVVYSYIEIGQVEGPSSWAYAIFERALYSLAFLSEEIPYDFNKFLKDLKSCRAQSVSYNRKIIIKEHYAKR